MVILGSHNITFSTDIRKIMFDYTLLSNGLGIGRVLTEVSCYLPVDNVHWLFTSMLLL